MDIRMSINDLIKSGLTTENAEIFINKIVSQIQSSTSPEEAWQKLSQGLLNAYPFAIHLLVFTLLFPKWREQPETAPAWIPSIEENQKSNIVKAMNELGINNVKAFHHWSHSHYEAFWQFTAQELNIQFQKKPEKICDLSNGIESPHWFKGAVMNITDSCFTAPDASTAIIYEDKEKNICRLSYGDLNLLSNRIANSLLQAGFSSGDAIAIAMPMNKYAIAIYLGIIKMGAAVVSIADSFSSHEMAVRLNIAKAKAVFTQDFIQWSGKKHSLYEKLVQANSPLCIVLSHETTNNLEISLRPGDIAWDDFLIDHSDFSSIPCDPMATCNILFSSGTTAEPKAIPWNHTTAIKAASDAYFHQDIQSGDILAWPTNLGWMMGPWLIFAALINHAAIALYPDAPKDRSFGKFIEQTKVTMLGVVPTLVAAWRQTQCMENIDWHCIKVFSSTGECSNPEDMLYLMSLAGYKPVIEYCGGTEIGGAYLTSTVIENNYPSLFSTPAMGLDLVILDEDGHASTVGEVAIAPPSVGLSENLLNADHHHVYFADMPTISGKTTLRRHGDQIKQLPNGYYSILGRVDDTMNLGGIKISSAEIERTIAGLPEVIETAAIAIPPTYNGPNLLIIYAVTSAALNKVNIKKEMQKRINSQLNPLFKIHDVVFTHELPKTASNKIMRRMLRKQYMEKQLAK